MTLSGTEYLKSTSRAPWGIIVGDYLISLPFEYAGRGAFSALDLTTMTAKAYTLPNEHFAPQYYGVYSHVVAVSSNVFYDAFSSLWSGNQQRFVKLDTTTMIASIIKSTPLGRPLVVYDSDTIIGDTVWTISTSTSSDVFGSYKGWSARGVVGSKHYRASGTTAVQIDTSGTVLDTITLTVAPGATTAAVIGTTIFWGTGSSVLVGIDTSTNTPVTVPTSPPGIPNIRDVMAGSDGYLYSYLSSIDSLVIVDPATGRWASEPLSPSRSERTNVVEYNGKLWIPSGQPDPWP